MNVECITFTGPVGPLEGILTVPEAPSFCAVVAHPHPRYGGTMDNTVVAETARVLRERGGVVLRFNFRGVGRSAGTYDDGVGERRDLQAALDEVSGRFSALPTFLAGYSFGSYVVLSRVVEMTADEGNGPPPRGVLALAPPLTAYDLSFLKQNTVPLAIVCGEVDPFTPPGNVRVQSPGWAKLVHLEFLPDAAHDMGTPLRSRELREAVDRAFSRLLDPSPTDQGSKAS